MSTALDVVDDLGVAGVSLRGVARAVGVSAPAIYAHFANLDAILLAVAERVFADLAQCLVDAGDDVPAGAARVRAVCRAYLDYAEQHPGRYQVMFGGLWDATAAISRGTVAPGAVDTLGRSVRTVFIDAMNDPGESVPPSDREAVTRATLAWTSLHGYAHQRLVARAYPWPDDFAETVLDRVAEIANLP